MIAGLRVADPRRAQAPLVTSGADRCRRPRVHCRHYHAARDRGTAGVRGTRREAAGLSRRADPDRPVPTGRGDDVPGGSSGPGDPQPEDEHGEEGDEEGAHAQTLTERRRLVEDDECGASRIDAEHEGCTPTASTAVARPAR